MSRDWVERAQAQGYGHLVIRDSVIEECAREIEARTSDAWCKWASDIAVVLRGLKDKP